jgi:hypothetical protein
MRESADDIPADRARAKQFLSGSTEREAGLGAAFPPEIREAWTAADGWIADTMQQAVTA